jgi:hypothetical protein
LIGRFESLFNRNGFTGHAGLVYEKSRGLHELGIGGNQIPLGQHQSITRYDVDRGDFLLTAIADHPRPGSAQAGEGGNSSVRPYFLNDSNRCVHHDHHRDDHRVGQVADAHGEDDRGKQQDDHRVPELGTNPPEQPNAVLRDDCVGTEFGQPRTSLSRTQTHSGDDLIRHNQGSPAESDTEGLRAIPRTGAGLSLLGTSAYTFTRGIVEQQVPNVLCEFPVLIIWGRPGYSARRSSTRRRMP